VLTGAARSWIIFAVVWGAILYVGVGGVNAALGHNNGTSVNQYNTLVTEFNGTGTAVQRAGRAAQTCTTIECIRPSHLAAANSLSSFAGDLDGMSFPSNASNSAQHTASDAHRLANIFGDLAHSSDASAYQSTAQHSNLDSLLTSYGQDAQNLLGQLKSDIP